MTDRERARRQRRVVYSAVDVLRLLAALAALGVVLLVINYGASSLAGAEADLIKLTARLPSGVTQFAVRIVQLVAVFAPVLGFGALVFRRHFRRLGGSVIAAVAGGVIGRWIMSDLLDLTVDRFAITGALRQGAPFPSAPFLASIAAIVAADSPWMSSRWRHAARGWLALLLALRLFSGTTGLRELIVAVAVGWVVGSLVGVLVGAPDRRPSSTAVNGALTRLGVSVAEVHHVHSGSGRHHFLVRSITGRRLWVEVAARDGWQTMLPGRLYRALRFRDAADGRPFAGLREMTEHEALVALKARGDGVPTPEIEAIGEVDNGGYLLAYRAVEGRSLRKRTDIGAEALPTIWKLVVRLRQARIAHRGLDQSSILVDGDDDTMLVVHFAAADLTGDERLLATDIAEVLAWSSERFGVEASVDAAIAALGPGVVARSLPRLQPLALTPATRGEVSSETLERIGSLVRERTGVDQPVLAPLERIKPRAVFTAIMAVIAINALAPYVAGFGKVWVELQDASVAWIVVAFVLSATTYLGAALALSGSIADPLPFGPNLAVQVAASFASIAAPAQIGGVALKGRFLQRRGTDPAVAVAAIGLNTVAAFLVHLTILFAFVFWAGSSDLGKISLPSGGTIGIVAGAVAVVIAITAALPVGRRYLAGTVLPAVRRSAQGIVDVARRPVRLGGLLGGSAIITLSYAGSLVASVAAFHGDLPVSAVAIVYLIGAVVQSVAPTPGGLGAAEAAYIGGLTAIGLPSERAVAAVLLFRLLTFWLPVVPGWVAMTWLTRSDAL
ncbi:MAG: lysylphosphatidylglycerol synthase transmembrane domain-containing protein [Acidimicrobiales bacterium]